MELTLLTTIISLAIILEGLFIALMPKATKKLMTHMVNNLTKLRIIGIIEIIVGIIILVVTLT